MERNLYLDNLKFILIFFVVLGHFANLSRIIPIFGIINNIIYSFHMPLFIFASGYLSKNILGPRKKDIDQVLYTYFVFEILNFIFTKLTTIGQGTNNVFIPTAQNWYLLGLFFWRLFLPYCRKYNKNTALIATIIIALSIGFYDQFNTFLGLYRIIYFMPYFLLGNYCNDLFLLIEKYVRFRVLFLIFLLFSFLFIAILSLHSPELNKAIAYAFTPFKGYASPSIRELYLRVTLRIIGFIGSIVISFCFLFIVPNKKTFYTHLGEHTLNVYLLHMFIVFPIIWIFETFNINIATKLIVSIFTSLLVTVGLSSILVNKLILPLTNWNKMAVLLSKSWFGTSRLGLTNER